jgi:hypothetical protein
MTARRIKHILVPTDFSETADRALWYASGLARSLKRGNQSISTTFAVQEKLMPAVHTATMRAALFHGVDDVRVEDVPRPTPDRAKPS